MPTLQSITDEILIAAVNSARERVVFIAPAVWPPLARAVSDAWRRLGAGGVTAILDVNAEVCRFGFGSMKGLEILQKAATSAGETLGNEPGVRICVLIADQQTFVFSPTPRLLEPSPGEPTDAATTVPKTNGIVLTSPIPNLEAEVGVGAGSEKELTRTIGLDPVKPTDVAAVDKELKENPPKPVDLARAVNVYNARIQFVELTVARSTRPSCPSTSSIFSRRTRNSKRRSITAFACSMKTISSSPTRNFPRARSRRSEIRSNESS